MKRKLILLSMFSLIIFSCGKNGGDTSKKITNGGVGQLVNFQAVKDAPFTSTERALGKAFCDNLQYKNSNFFELYGATKKFKFAVDLNDCSHVTTGGKSSY